MGRALQAIAKVLLGSALAVPAGAFADTAANPFLVPLNPYGGFDVSLAGWTAVAPAGGAIAWSPDDAAGDPNSGAARLHGPSGTYELYACWIAPYDERGLAYRSEQHVRAFGDGARLRVLVTMGFSGDDAGRDDCPAFPLTEINYAVDTPLAAAGLFGTVQSAPRFTFAGVPIRILVTVDKLDGADVLLDDVQLVRDVEALFRTEF